MLLSKRVRYHRVHRGRITGKTHRGSQVAHGDFDLQALEPAWITSNQIEAARIVMTRCAKRFGGVWIRTFPDEPVTKKPAETCMGFGEDVPGYWVAIVKPGKVMFGIGDAAETTAREAMCLAVNKLPIKCKFVKKEETDGEQS